MALWLGHHPQSQKAASLIPSQGIRLGCGPDPLSGVYERQLINVSFTH